MAAMRNISVCILALTGLLGCSSHGSPSAHHSILPPSVQAPWGTPADLTDNIYLASSGLRMASNGNGMAILVWKEKAGWGPSAASSLMASVYSRGNWSSPLAVESNFQHLSYIAPNYAVAMDGSGNATVVWSSSQYSPYTVRAKRWIASTFQWAGNTIDLGTTDLSAYPAVAMGDDGTTLAAWCYNKQLLSCVFKGGSWGAAIPIQDLSASRPGNFIGINGDAPVSLSMNAQGQGLLGWISVENNYGKLHAVRFDGGSWGSIATLSDLNWSGGGVCTALDEMGQAILSWTDFPSPTSNVSTAYSVFGDPSGAWSSVQALPSDAATPQVTWPFFLAPDGQGGFWGAWTARSITTSYVTTPLVGRFSTGSWATPNALTQGTAGGNQVILSFHSDRTSNRPMALTGAETGVAGSLRSFTWEGSTWTGPYSAGQIPSAAYSIAEGTLVKIGPNQALSGIAMVNSDPNSPYADKANWTIWSARYN